MLDQKQLNTYLKAIGVSTITGLTADNLNTIVYQHNLTFRFGNLDMHHRGNISRSIDLADIFTKMVLNQREGCCIETTEFLRGALVSLGFRTKRYLAKVMWHQQNKTFPYHELLIVEIENSEYLVEPGFGATTPLEPVLFRQHSKLVTNEQLFAKSEIKWFRFVFDLEGEYQLQTFDQSSSSWHAMYSFLTTQECQQDELNKVNNYLTVSAESPFFKSLFITGFIAFDNQIIRATLTQNLVMGTFNALLPFTENVEQSIRSQAHFLAYLKELFKINLPTNTEFTAKGVRFSELIPDVKEVPQILITYPGSPFEGYAISEIPPNLFYSHRDQKLDLSQFTRSFDPEWEIKIVGSKFSSLNEKKCANIVQKSKSQDHRTSNQKFIILKISLVLNHIAR